MTRTVSLGHVDSRAGGKALGLRWLHEQGYQVPATWVLLPPFSEPIDVAGIPGAGQLYAVRSSANVEDGGLASYAGQFASVLNVAGGADLASAVRRVLDSSSVEGVASYRRHQGDDRAIEMSVIIQEMVTPVVSGVAFSKNPMTGLSEILLECVEGSGELLQGEGVTPYRWVHRWGEFIEAPDSETLPDAVVERLVSDVAAIASAFGSPVDAEWVYDGVDIWWVQVRPITGLDDITIYSRRIAKEVLPGMIKPLVWSINVPMVNRAWLDLLEEAVGDLGLRVEDLARAFGYRAYFNMTAFGEVFAALGMPRESLELLLGLPMGTDQPTFKPSHSTVAKTPNMVGMGLRRLGYGRHVDASLPELERVYRGFAEKDLADLDDGVLLADIEELRRIGIEAARLNVVTPLLANVFDSLLRRVLTNSGVDPMSLAPSGQAVAYDPNPHLDDIAARVSMLDPAERAAIVEGGYGAMSGELKEAFDEFLDRFGHFSDSGNDFSVAPWSEKPDVVVRMVAARQPLERAPVSASVNTVPRWKIPAVRYLRGKAQTYGSRRDAVSSTYTYGYGLFREYFLELGRRLTDRAVIADVDDIMYLSFDEVVDAVEHGGDLQSDVEVRRSEMENLEDVHMPDIIYGDEFVPLSADADAAVWTGTATARGHHRGIVRIVRGLDEFEKVHPGDVIVIPFSDVGWTPLFAKAGAVVAESGGMLSHSSIVAREYGLPCVVSVPGALRIPDGSTVVVDGYRGTVTLEEES